MSSNRISIPAYSDEALAARDILFVAGGGVHFFVEDVDHENMYTMLLGRCFPEIEAFDVFPLGGKSSVLAHASAEHKVINGIKRVYVLDKDFDDLLGRKMERPDIFYFDEFCVENMVIDEESILEICVQESPKTKRKELAERLSYEAMMGDWLPQLDRLHRAYLICQRYELPRKNTSLPVDDYVQDKMRYRVCRDKVEAFVSSIFGDLVNLGVVSTPAEYEELLAAALPECSLVNVNGKYLLSLIYFHLKQKKLIYNAKWYSLVYRCASACSLQKFGRFRVAVLNHLALFDTGATKANGRALAAL